MSQYPPPKGMWSAEAHRGEGSLDAAFHQGARGEGREDQSLREFSGRFGIAVQSGRLGETHDAFGHELRGVSTRARATHARM